MMDDRLVKLAEKKQMIRLVVMAGYWRCGCLMATDQENEERGNNTSYVHTRWYRHDENLQELELYARRFTRMFFDAGADTVTCHYETKEYKNLEG